MKTSVNAKKMLTVIVCMLTFLYANNESYGSQYEFASSNGWGAPAYLSIDMTISNSTMSCSGSTMLGWGSLRGVPYNPLQTTMLWNVDPAGMTTTLQNVTFSNNSTVSNQGQLSYSEPGFGGQTVYFPFAISANGVVFSDSTGYGPYSINPVGLGFDMPGTNTNQSSLSLNGGQMDILGQQISIPNLNLGCLVSQGWNVDEPSFFTDSGYPQQLQLNNFALEWSNISPVTIQVNANGYTATLSLTAAVFLNADGGSYQGNLVPEPCSIILLGLGSLLTCRRRK
jgi:hypothetical protein